VYTQSIFLSQRSTPSRTGSQHKGTYHTLLTASTTAGSAEAGQPSTTGGTKHHRHATQFAPWPLEIQISVVAAPRRCVHTRHPPDHGALHTVNQIMQSCTLTAKPRNDAYHADVPMQCCTDTRGLPNTPCCPKCSRIVATPYSQPKATHSVRHLHS
jgi:hypothetical protein